MNVTLLIDSIVRQTTILIAELATASGTRAPLAHTANQVFLDLVRGLKEQGLGNKVIADMFGMALRTYHDRVQRLSESSTFRGKSLWAAVLEFVQEGGSVVRNEVLLRFSQDDSASVRGILADLVDLGLVYRSGRGDHTEYRARRGDEAETDAAALERIANLVWVAIHRYGPVSASEIAKVIPADEHLLNRAIDKLAQEGRVTREPDNEPTYKCDFCLLGLDEPLGWEAAVFDHYQALVRPLRRSFGRGAHGRSDPISSGVRPTPSTYGRNTRTTKKSWDSCARLGTGQWRCVRRSMLSIRLNLHRRRRIRARSSLTLDRPCFVTKPWEIEHETQRYETTRERLVAAGDCGCCLR